MKGHSMNLMTDIRIFYEDITVNVAALSQEEEERTDPIFGIRSGNKGTINEAQKYLNLLLLEN